MLAVGTSSSAVAQAVAGQWTFNRTSSAEYFGTTGGSQSGTAAGYGQGVAAPFANVLENGSPGDPGLLVDSTLYNRRLTVNPPLTSTENLSTGVKFSISTVGMAPGQPVSLNWSMTVGYRSSRFWQVLASTDGVNFSPVPTGTGSSFSGTVNGLDGAQAPISGVVSVSVSNDGLIDFQTMDQNFINTTTTAAGWVDDISYTFPLGLGFENNPNFAVAIVGAFDPSYSGISGMDGYVSSFTGESTNASSVSGYNRSSGAGGSMGLDLVTVVPEPATYAAMLGGLCLLVTLLRRRRHTL